MSNAILSDRAAAARLGLAAANSTEDEAPLPFSSALYSHRHRIPPLFSDIWAELRTKSIPELVDDDPFSPSTHRDKGFKIWDAAITIPACRWRLKYSAKDKVGAVRSVNSGFLVHTGSAFAKASPVLGGWRRPKSPFILDLISQSRGWEYLELCSVLAHHSQLHEGQHPTQILKWMRFWLAKLLVSLRYDLPLLPKTGEVWQPYGAGDVFPPYKIMLALGPDSMNPVASLPLSGVGSPVPDQTIAVVTVGLYTETIPRGFGDGSLRWTAATRWCCGLSQAVIGGWELIDVVTHMPIHLDRGTYVLHHMDMQDAATFPAYIEAAKARFGAADGWSALELLDSQYYQRLKECAPPLPSAETLVVRPVPDIGLIRPMTRRPETKLDPRNREHQGWIDWDKALEDIRLMIENATIFYERRSARVSNSSSVTASRKRRLQAWRKLKQTTEKIKKLRIQSLTYQRDGWLQKSKAANNEANELQNWIDSQLKTQEKENSSEGQAAVKTEEAVSCCMGADSTPA